MRLNKNDTLSCVLAWLPGLLWVCMLPGHGQSIFDAGLGTLPQDQGWTYGAIGAASGYHTNDSVLFDTTPSTSTLAGWSEIAPTNLNRTNGFSLHFTARIDAETHTSTNRAGFSVIVLSDDAHGLELGFWNNTIFVQSDNPLFTHGEEVTIPTTNSFVDYGLSLFPTNYILTANGAVILTGPVRNYTAYNGPFNIYSTPNFLFMGDDTSSASGREEIQSVTLITVPKLAIDRAGVVTWAGMLNRTYEFQVSSDLISWSRLESIRSNTSIFRYTNSTWSSPQFYRIVVP